MSEMLAEIAEMPEMANTFLERSPSFTLPTGVPYLGMGSSYFAPLAFKYMGLDIFPELASEFYSYLRPEDGTRIKIPYGVLLSQSGRSSEVLWCAELFEKFIAITNDARSPLCQSAGRSDLILLHAGDEKYSSSKTYINTLLSLFAGFGMDMRAAIKKMTEKMQQYDRQGQALASAVFAHMEKCKAGGYRFPGIYITGNGPNIATALQAALILSETTKLNFHGLAMAQYDHGPKETARNSLVIQIAAAGRSYARTKALEQTIRTAGAHVLSVEEPDVAEYASVIHNMIPFNFMAYYLSEALGIQETFQVGGKVTEVKA